MIIVIRGISDKNKGAELMMYAIIQAFEKKYPGSTYYLPAGAIKRRGGIHALQTNADVRYKPDANRILRWKKYKISSALSKLHINFFYFDDVHPIKGADYFIDASGFYYSDQWKITKVTIERLRYQLHGYKKQGTKIIFLPQAFGPVSKENTKKIIKVIGEHADLIMPREEISYQYVIDVLGTNKKIQKFTDFTSLVEGIFPQQYENIKNGICIIPSNKMFSKGVVSRVNYIKLIKHIIKNTNKSGHPIYLLSHEDGKDQLLVQDLQKEIGSNIIAVYDLPALEVKGLISSAYFCITSRFHGAASALNSCVPCLATSWSHKYGELFKDYGLDNSLLPVDDSEEAIEIIGEALKRDRYNHVKNILQANVKYIKDETTEMWNIVYGEK